MIIKTVVKILLRIHKAVFARKNLLKRVCALGREGPRDCGILALSAYIGTLRAEIMQRQKREDMASSRFLLYPFFYFLTAI